MKILIPHVALLYLGRRHAVLTVWGRTLIHWRKA